MNFEKYTSGLVQKGGIFFSDKSNNVSYPESGNNDSFQLEENSFWFIHRNNCIIAAVQKYCPEKLFFDIGGGNGFTSKGLEKNGIPTILVEPGIHGCLNAKNRGLENIICSTLENANFKKGSIPAMGLFDVVEHIENDLEFLKTLNEFLEDNGYVFITVPSYKFLWSNEDVFAGHFRRYTLVEMENKLRSAGFEIIYSTYIFMIVPFAIYALRTLPSKFGFFKEPSKLDEHQRDHQSNKGVLNGLLNTIWNYELNQVKKGRKIQFGGSCFVVARKIKN